MEKPAAPRASLARAREGGFETVASASRDAAVLVVIAALAFAGTLAIGALFLGAPPMVDMVVGWFA